MSTFYDMFTAHSFFLFFLSMHGMPPIFINIYIYIYITARINHRIWVFPQYITTYNHGFLDVFRSFLWDFWEKARLWRQLHGGQPFWSPASGAMRSMRSMEWDGTWDFDGTFEKQTWDFQEIHDWLVVWNMNLLFLLGRIIIPIDWYCSEGLKSDDVWRDFPAIFHRLAQVYI